MAEETGGFAVVNTNDFAGEFKRIDAETSDYYVLGFYSSNPDPTKRTRTLEVKVDRPNVDGRVAHGLLAEDAGQAAGAAADQEPARNKSSVQDGIDRLQPFADERGCGAARRRCRRARA